MLKYTANIEWEEVESSHSSQKTTNLREVPKADPAYAPEEIVRVSIQVKTDYSIEEVIEKILEEIPKEDYFEVHNSYLAENFITANLTYEKIELVKEIEGVVSVEVVGKAQLTQEKNSQESKKVSQEKVQEEELNEKQEIKVAQEKTSSQRKPENNNSIFGITIGILILLLGIAWRVKRKNRR